MDTEEILREIYYDPEKGYTSIEKIYKKLKENDITISRKKIKEFIAKQETHQIHKKETKLEGSFIPTSLNHQYQVDLIYLEDQRLNHQKKYALTCVNISSKVLDIELLNKKDSISVSKAMKNILDKRGSPKSVYTDEGAEFIASNFKKLMKDHDIDHVITKGHSAFIETIHRTIKNMLAKYKTSTNSKTWINVIQKIVDNYNNSYHSVIKMNPNQVNEDNMHIVQMNIIKKAKPKLIREILSINDSVRIKLWNKQDGFKKGYKPKWSPDVYLVKEIIGNKYKLDNNILYLRNELQKIGAVEKNPNQADIKGFKENTLLKKQSNFT
jgi:transposase-like protein